MFCLFCSVCWRVSLWPWWEGRAERTGGVVGALVRRVCPVRFVEVGATSRRVTVAVWLRLVGWRWPHGGACSGNRAVGTGSGRRGAVVVGRDAVGVGAGRGPAGGGGHGRRVGAESAPCSLRAEGAGRAGVRLGSVGGRLGSVRAGEAGPRLRPGVPEAVRTIRDKGWRFAHNGFVFSHGVTRTRGCPGARCWATVLASLAWWRFPARTARPTATAYRMVTRAVPRA